jgi:hypothetical protein
VATHGFSVHRERQILVSFTRAKLLLPIFAFYSLPCLANAVPVCDFPSPYAGRRTLSTGLCGALKRQAGHAVTWTREATDIQAQIDDLPQGTSCHTEAPEWKLFDQLVDAKDKAAAWLAKVSQSEHHMRTGAFKSFDINEAIKTSDRRIAEKLLKNTVPVGEEPGV